MSCTTRSDALHASPLPSPVAGKSLGILLAAGPAERNFDHALALADAALTAGARVFVYCLDAAVEGLDQAQLRALRARGMVLFACAYGARRRNVVLGDQAVFAGLTVVADLIADTDRFVSFT